MSVTDTKAPKKDKKVYATRQSTAISGSAIPTDNFQKGNIKDEGIYLSTFVIHYSDTMYLPIFNSHKILIGVDEMHGRRHPS